MNVDSVVYSAMSREQYQSALSTLQKRHPWLVHPILAPAPGHLAVLEHLLQNLEKLLPEKDRKRTALVCVSHKGNQTLEARFELKDDNKTKALAVRQAIVKAQLEAHTLCAVCGAHLSPPERVPPRCEEHHTWRKSLFVTEEGGMDEADKSTPSMKSTQAQQPEPKRTWGVGGDPEGDPFEDFDIPEPIDPEPIEGKQDDTDALFQNTLGDLRKRQLEKKGANADLHAKNPLPKGPWVAFPSSEAVDAVLQGVGYERKKRLDGIVQRIKEVGTDTRALGVLPNDWKAIPDEFEAYFPNFAPLAGILRRSFALAARGDQRIHWSPVLLVGPAGIGKTEAAKWLAKRLSLPFKVFDMASAQTGSPLGGSEEYWGNAEPGELFKLLAYESKANPIVLLDELDKAMLGQKQYDPLAPLYTLLESSSAGRFQDLCIRELTLDAGHINWFMTANDGSVLPAPLLSRMQVLQIDPPNQAQTQRIIQNIYKKVCEEAPWGASFAETLDEDVLAYCGAFPPRQLRKIILQALGEAALAGRNAIRSEDMLKHQPPAKRQGIGFCAF
jgi:ATP-dependent Lon protease